MALNIKPLFPFDHPDELFRGGMQDFEILTSDPDISSVDFKKVATRIAQINTLDAFMNRYKKN